jgi:hypothetical protein
MSDIAVCWEAEMSYPVQIDVDRVVELTRLGWTARQIADELGYSARTVQRARVRAGVGRPLAARWTDEELARAQQMFDDGASIAEVGRTIRGIGGGGALYRRFSDYAWPQDQVMEFIGFCSRMSRIRFNPSLDRK